MNRCRFLETDLLIPIATVSSQFGEANTSTKAPV